MEKAESFRDEDVLKLMERHSLKVFDARRTVKGYAGTFNFKYKADEFDELAAMGEFAVRGRHKEIMEMLVSEYRKKNGASGGAPDLVNGSNNSNV